MNISNKRLLKQIITQIPNYVFWKDTNLIYQGCNYNFARAAGFEYPEQIIGKKDDDMKWGKHTAGIYQAEDREIIQTGKPLLNKEVPMIMEANRELYLSVSKVPLYDDNGTTIGVLGIYIDITRQKEAQKDKEELKKTKYQLEGAKLISGSIAHEIRTPLAAIKLGIQGIDNTFSKLIDINQFVSDKNLAIETIADDEVARAKKAIKSINRKVDQSNVVINMLLTKLQSIDFEFSKFSLCSASQCVKNAINEFVLPDNMYNKVNFNKDNDFKFMGNSTLVMHIIMNLLKNAIFYIIKAGKGEIVIWLEQHQEFNQIHFKDTGTGIPSEILPHIFDSFFTTESSTGTGVGLAFSKMVMQSHQGKIDCLSKEGEYTEYILSFPKLDKEQAKV